ncbi:hypothetical protein F5J12DRAFT_18697 [Pisolithus orientalis]|uniref:uncharacterized protein n=1 Tax=Pisolithus orientalis TaxID=936130 RepID=UPI0022256FB7|nr:uncharacterized protein F5J12DRAFT_18697 [Pisolithus orientalis]KAI6035265.1 hypothetical protein F5J12DRAFT_18697 [Pisolithus orientalis]
MASTREDSSEVFDVQPLAAVTEPTPDGDSEEGAFIYPSVADDSDEEFVYPATSENTTVNDPSPPAPSPEPTTSATESTTRAEQSPSPFALPVQPIQNQSHPSPAQLEALCAAASSGDLALLEKLFSTVLQSGELEPFALANDASSRTGYTALHSAASRGFLDIVRWLIEECGAMPDLEDREGEAALHGHLPIIKYLLLDKADVHARDADGWTALHNACSKGYLDIVRWLCEQGGAATESNNIKGVDLPSNDGWTPLMNAASKGHLPVVLYLLTKQGANPVARNNWGETAYDVAAAVFEVWICEVLQKAEAERWRYTTVPYNPLAVHTTVPLILYEYQRLDMRFKTLAVSGGKPKFSSFGLGKHGHHPPFELRLPSPDEDTGAVLVASSRSDDQRPLRTAPYTLCKPSRASRAMPEATEKSHFWLSDWTLDITPPGVDAEFGWQYAPAFDTADEEWSAERPPQLERLLSGSGFMTAGLSTSTRTYNHVANASSSASSSRSVHAQTWVRRRRWVRLMRRRLDMPPLPFMQPDGALYHLATDGTLIPCIGEVENGSPGDPDGLELGTMPPNPLSLAQDYVARARYLVGNRSRDTEIDREEFPAIEARRVIAKLERATTELRQGILGDDNLERRTQAEVLLNTYGRELERRRLSASAQGLIMLQSDDDPGDDNNDDDDEKEFHYPGGSPSESVRASTVGPASADHRTSVSRTPSDLTPHLSQAAEFRVPTCEAPQKMVTSRWQPTPHLIYARWERDEEVTVCNNCRRRFTFILRRHCRKCGRIFCDRCSSHRAPLDASDIVYDPAFTETIASGSLQRVCDSCFSEPNASMPARYQTSGVVEDTVDHDRLAAPNPLSRQISSSQLSDLAECPVCAVSLADLGLPADQEAHVKGCLDGGLGPSAPQAAKYLVYKLPAESTLLGVECVICLEEFTKGSLVARLSCLCSFHNACFVSWLKRDRYCPVHAR